MLSYVARDSGPRPAWRQGIIAESASMRALLALVERIAPSNLSVLLSGETGSGKEVLAHGIHEASARLGRFVAVNCAAIPANLVESELFGHERGAFTGAETTTIGLIEGAENGTLFLDEVAELDLRVQAKLLRALESGEVRRVGGRRTTFIDTRIVAATHRDLSAAVATGRFREDLYYRINGVMLEVPPLRARVDDIEFLARRFLIEATKAGERPVLTDEVVAWLKHQSWPGNVRELRQSMRRAIVLGGCRLTPLDFAPPVVATMLRPMTPGVPSESAFDAWLAGKRWSDIETTVLTWAVHRFGGIRGAARALHMPRSTVCDRVRRLGILCPNARSTAATDVEA